MDCARRIYGDFHNMDSAGRVRLNVRGSLGDLSRAHDSIANGSRVLVYDEDLEADAVAEWSQQEAIWVARLESEIRLRADLRNRPQ